MYEGGVTRIHTYGGSGHFRVISHPGDWNGGGFSKTRDELFTLADSLFQLLKPGIRRSFRLGEAFQN